MAALPVALAVTAPRLGKLPVPQNGDIVFQTYLGVQDIAVMLATRSVYSHMGMVKIRGDGLPMVVEAVGPVQEIPLQDWMDRGVGKRVSLWRAQEMPAEAPPKAFAWARQHYGKPYDIYFLPGHDAFYCSELVRDSFEDGAGLKLGRYEKVSDLVKSHAMDEIIHERWRSYPLCKDDKSLTEEKCRAIIMRQELITPASIAADPKLHRIYSNYLFETW
jgi:hypothetical protein